MTGSFQTLMESNQTTYYITIWHSGIKNARIANLDKLKDLSSLSLSLSLSLSVIFRADQALTGKRFSQYLFMYFTYEGFS